MPVRHLRPAVDEVDPVARAVPGGLRQRLNGKAPRVSNGTAVRNPAGPSPSGSTLASTKLGLRDSGRRRAPFHRARPRCPACARFPANGSGLPAEGADGPEPKDRSRKGRRAGREPDAARTCCDGRVGGRRLGYRDGREALAAVRAQRELQPRTERVARVRKARKQLPKSSQARSAEESKSGLRPDRSRSPRCRRRPKLRARRMPAFAPKVAPGPGSPEHAPGDARVDRERGARLVVRDPHGHR